MPKAHFITTAFGQLRVWRAGTGPDLLVLPGLIAAASVRAESLGVALPGWTITVVALPGLGSSAAIWAEGIDGLAARIVAAADAIGLGRCAVLAFDLAAPLAIAVAGRLATAPAAILLAEDAAARAWAGRGLQPAALAPQADGTHLARLCAHLRDCHVLDPRHPQLPGRTGAPLPGAAELDATVVAAAVAPRNYERLWSICAEAMAACEVAAVGGVPVIRLPAADDARAVLAELTTGLRTGLPLPPTRPAADPAATWYDYADTPAGRVHLRRAGAGGRPLLAFHSAPGSAAPLAPLLAGLSHRRQVIAPDYLGNGDSDKPERAVDIAVLAGDALAVADALGLDEFDLWGTHTGALVALELAVSHPGRVGRVILEAPVLISADFAADILEHYLPPLRPDRWGLHLLQAWNMRRDMFLFWPWYRQERAAGRPIGVPEPEVLHDWTVGLLKSGATYDRSYRAAFEYDTRPRLSALTRPALICAGPADMLAEGLREAERLAPAGTVVTATPATVWYPGQAEAAVAETLAIYDAFLRG